MYPRYGVNFVLLAAASLFCAILWIKLSLVVTAILIYTALSFVVVSIAYFGGGPRMLLKNADGSMSWASLILLLPYHLFNELCYVYFRAFVREEPYVQIVPGLYLGRRLLDYEARRALKLGWVGVIDLVAESPEAPSLRTLEHYRSIALLDRTALSGQEMGKVVEWVSQIVEKGPVFIHCAFGHGRSATLMVACLIHGGHVPGIEEGIALLKSKRPGVGLNSAQIKSLEEFLATKQRDVQP